MRRRRRRLRTIARLGRAASVRASRTRCRAPLGRWRPAFFSVCQGRLCCRWPSNVFFKHAKSRRSAWHRAHLIGASVHTGMAKQLMGEEPAANGIGFCLVGIPFAAACFFREQIRVHYNIGGHAICDGCCAVLCLQCTLCQIYRQLKAKPVMRSKLSSDFSSHLYEFYQVHPPPSSLGRQPRSGNSEEDPSARATRVEGGPTRPVPYLKLKVVDSVLAHNRIFRRRLLCAWRRAWPLASCDEKWGRIASGRFFRNRVHTVMLADSRIHLRYKTPKFSAPKP